MTAGLIGCDEETSAPNRPPQIVSVTLVPEEPVAGDEVTATALATDPDDDTLAFQWGATAGAFIARARSDQENTIVWRTPDVAAVCTLTVRVDDGHAIVRDQRVVTVQEPNDDEALLVVEPDLLVLSIGVSEAAFTVRNGGGGVLRWTAAGDPDWLTAVPAQGSATTEIDTVTVFVDRTGFEVGTETGFVTVAAGEDTLKLDVYARSVAEPVSRYEIVAVYPHDPAAFTQGLVIDDGDLFESTGLYGQSTLRRVHLEDGVVLQSISLPQQYFGEGITVWDDTIVQLTWSTRTGLIYDRETFALENIFFYQTQGWGLTDDGTHWIMSDGTSLLRFLDPVTRAVVDSLTVTVTHAGGAQHHLNELEYIDGEIFANIWLTNNIVRIDPASGTILGWIDLSGLLDGVEGAGDADVLNGIAYDVEADRLFVTGKLWPRLFEIRLVPATAASRGR